MWTKSQVVHPTHDLYFRFLWPPLTVYPSAVWSFPQAPSWAGEGGSTSPFASSPSVSVRLVFCLCPAVSVRVQSKKQIPNMGIYIYHTYLLHKSDLTQLWELIKYSSFVSDIRTWSPQGRQAGSKGEVRYGEDMWEPTQMSQGPRWQANKPTSVLVASDFDNCSGLNIVTPQLTCWHPHSHMMVNVMY